MECRGAGAPRGRPRVAGRAVRFGGPAGRDGGGAVVGRGCDVAWRTRAALWLAGSVTLLAVSEDGVDPHAPASVGQVVDLAALRRARDASSSERLVAAVELVADGLERAAAGVREWGTADDVALIEGGHVLLRHGLASGDAEVVRSMFQALLWLLDAGLDHKVGNRPDAG